MQLVGVSRERAASQNLQREEREVFAKTRSNGIRVPPSLVRSYFVFFLFLYKSKGAECFPLFHASAGLFAFLRETFAFFALRVLTH